LKTGAYVLLCSTKAGDLRNRMVWKNAAAPTRGAVHHYKAFR